ncbi:MAG: ABC transporter ATP-binding protein [Saprospiraceae bacterium]|nr:ABC transporter ATP-binding protein [Saprospiraceae bacterium]
MTTQKASYLQNFIALKYLPRFFRSVYKSSPKMFSLNVILRLIKSIFPVVLLWVGKEIIDEVIAIVNTGESQELNKLYLLIAIEFGIAIFSDVFNRLIGATDTLIGSLYSNDSSVELIQKTARVDLQYLEDSEFYDKLERARRQTVGRVNLMSNSLAQAQDFITIVSLISALIYFYPILIFLLVISIIPTLLNELKFSSSNYKLTSRMAPERRQLDYMRVIGASDVTAKEVKLFGLADFISRTFSTTANKYYQSVKKLTIKRSIWGAIFNIIGVIAYYGAFVFIVLKAVVSLVTIGELTFLAGSFNKLRNQLQVMFTRFSNITESALYLHDYFEFIDMEFIDQSDFQQLPVPAKIVTGIRFQNVTFSYPNGHIPVFNGLSFDLRKGEKLALVGENGSGKTTLIKLLLRLYEPTSGCILLDGVDIRHYEKEEYQKLFGAIFQDFVKYYLTTRINIAVGNIENVGNDKKIEEAAKLSLADEVVKDLLNGYDQELGKRFKKGAELSGGQWQKIALARAYMSEAPIIILDEPTSALDARAEYEVFQRFIGLTKGRTSIIISHRFSTVRMADRILVLNNGEVLELGTHEELMENGNLYSELFELQAEGYQ